MLNYEGIMLPAFMHDMDEYMRCLDTIAATNHIQTIEPPPTPPDPATMETTAPETIEEQKETDDYQEATPVSDA